jgi:hypothetical protein
MTLTDLQDSATEPNEVNVAIEYRADKADFKVVSTGFYGVATRKVEAIFKGIVTFGGGDQLGHPLYYTPSDIKIEATPENPVDLRTISMFSAGDILLQGDYENLPSSVAADRMRFITEMDIRSGQNAGYLKTIGQGQTDELADWCTTTACNTKAFRNIPGNWNTVERKENPDVYPGKKLTNPPGYVTDTTHNANADLLFPGLAAEGKICGFSVPVGSTPPPIGECPSDYPSIADGVYGYDCTTGPITVTKVNPLDDEPVCTGSAESRGNDLTFMAKECTPTNCDTTQDLTGDSVADYISYPFPRPEPIPEALHEHADLGDDATDKLWVCDPGLECFPPFDDLMGSKNEMVFVDANGATNVHFQASGTQHGIVVVWCGRLLQESDMQGVILNLHGDGSTFGASSCVDDGTKGTYRNMGNGTNFSGWLYSDGGTDEMAGIELAPGSVVNKFPGGKWNFEMDAFENAPPNAFSLRGWRECYQLEPVTECST